MVALRGGPTTALFFALWGLAYPALAEAPHPAYIGSQACATCHEREAAAWDASHHALAWTLPDETTVLGDFDDATFSHQGVTSRFFRRDGDFFVETDGPEGRLTTYPLRGVAGIAPLQQYLVEIEPGRLQALDIAWDVEGQRWYHLYPDQQLQAGQGLHWTGPYKTWNARCAECHATGFEKNYRPQSRRYESRWAEIGVGCEACHGPGEAHQAWAEGRPVDWPDLNAQGLTAVFAAPDSEAEIQLCAGCHARREPLGQASPLPGTPFHDAYRLALLRPGLYHADGTIDDEVYVYGSFLQSKMAAAGVRCSDCHDPHSAALKVEGNGLCTQCHAPAGNDRFPTLTRALYDDPAHHFHQTGTPGAQCKSCHMVERLYMGIDGRRDHSFRVPRPDLSAASGAPNACNDCHADRGADWAAAEIAARFPDSPRGGHFASTFAEGRLSPELVALDLADIAQSPRQPAIVRATALDLLRGAADAALLERLAVLVEDEDPLVRQAALRLQRGAAAIERVQRILPALRDAAASVRLTAAREMLNAPIARLPKADSEALQAGMSELQGALFAKADYPETQMAIGGMALVLRNLRAAEQAFAEAAHLDPQLLEAWSMVVRIRASAGDLAGARDAVEQGLSANPDSPLLLQMRRELAVAQP
ncbi:MAG: tetratricopeptide repeat protein [Rhodospirillales bacterium]